MFTLNLVTSGYLYSSGQQIKETKRNQPFTFPLLNFHTKKFTLNIFAHWSFQGLSNKYAQGFKCVKCAKGCETYKHVHAQYIFQGLSNKYAQGFKCVKCAKGCETCVDGSPCILALNWVQRSIVLGFSCFIMAFIPMLVWFTFRYSRVKVS